MLALLVVAQVGVVIGIINIGIQMTLYVSDSKDKVKSNRECFTVLFCYLSQLSL